MKKKVVVFGGGTGISFLLKALNEFPVDITAVISVSDNGSSTGKLREEFYMPAVGDLRQVLLTLSELDDNTKDLLNYRFDTSSDLDGHPLGNLLLTASYIKAGSLKSSIHNLCKFLRVKHNILPLSEDYLTLMAETEDGEIIMGESAIGKSNKRYKRLFYDKKINVDKEILDEIKSADLILFSVGSLYTSLLPNLLSKDIVRALDKIDAPILYTCNAVTQIGETNNFTVSDHIKVINNHLNKRKVDAVIASDSFIPDYALDKYKRYEGKNLVKVDEKEVKKLGCELIKQDLLVVNEKGLIRHHSLKFATVIFNYLMR